MNETSGYFIKLTTALPVLLISREDTMDTKAAKRILSPKHSWTVFVTDENEVWVHEARTIPKEEGIEAVRDWVIRSREVWGPFVIIEVRSDWVDPALW
jgi:hypothetical protein